jgi:hypothetical protein
LCEENYIMRNFIICTHCCTGDKIEKNEMSGICSLDGEGGGVYRVLVRKPEGKIPLARSRPRWGDNIKMDLHEVECGVWTRLGWLRIEPGGGHLRMR